MVLQLLLMQVLLMMILEQPVLHDADTPLIDAEVLGVAVAFAEDASAPFNPHQNDQGRKGPCYFQRLIALKCLKCCSNAVFVRNNLKLISMYL
jgi:hypothetical protein